MLKRIAATFGASLLLGLTAFIGSAVPAGASHGNYKICNSSNSDGLLHADNIYSSDPTTIVPGGSYCKYVTNYGGGLRIDPDREALNPSDIDRYRMRAAQDQTYGPWHTDEYIINPPDAWQSQGGIYIQTDVL